MDAFQNDTAPNAPGPPQGAATAAMVLDALRRAPFLDAPRGRRLARAASVGIGLSVLGLILTGRGGADHNGTAPGGDFVVYWMAARLAQAGHAAQAYIPDLMAAAEHRAVTMRGDGFLPFFYPPTWLVLLLPFATLPYVAAWIAFVASTGGCYVLLLRQLLPAKAQAPGMWLAIAGFPALLVNAGTGQNGFVTGAALAIYGVLLDRRPFLAGAGLGLLCIKPQFALAAPVALLAARRLRPLAGAAAAAAALALASLALFGPAPWRACLGALPLAREMVDTQLIYRFKLVSVLGGLRLLGVPERAALMVHAAAAALVLGCLARATARRPGALAEVALLAAATLLVTPYATDYDLCVAGVAMAALFAAAQTGGFLDWEKSILVACYALPLAGPALARAGGLPVAAPVMGALFWLAVRRGLRGPPPRPSQHHAAAEPSAVAGPIS